MKKFAVIIILLTLPGMAAYAQKEKILTYKGNNALAKGDIESAREAYTEALKINPKYSEAQFNLGNTYQMESRALLEQLQSIPDQGQQQAMLEKVHETSKMAAAEYEKLTGEVKEADKVNKLQYNLGNAQVLGGELDKGIDAYKEALRKDPTDEDARYNLAYAQYLKKQQEQQQQQDQDDQEKNDQEKQEQDEQKPDENKDDQEQNKDEQQQDQLSKEDAQKMLDALAKQEKDLQDKLNKKKIKAQPIKIEKNW